MARITEFRSMAEPDKYCYTVHDNFSDLRDWSAAGPRVVDDHCGMYDTYGDGMTQHSPVYAVGAERMGDLCASLVAHLTEHPEFLGPVAGAMGRHDAVDRARLRWLASVRPGAEGKTKYFNIPEMKTSTNDSKRHDKRWHVVPDWADGTARAVVGMIKTSDHVGYMDLLSLFKLYDAARDEISSMSGQYQYNETTAIYMDLPPHAGTAVEALLSLLDSQRMAERARRLLESYRHNTANMAPKETEVA